LHAASGRRPSPDALRTDPDGGTRPSTDIGCDLDEAITLFRKAMPDYGLKLVVPPPLPDGKAGRLSLSAWRRGNELTRVHCGATAGEALRRLFDSEVREARRRRRRAACPLCRGIGWYIASDGVRTNCAHPNAQD